MSMPSYLPPGITVYKTPPLVAFVGNPLLFIVFSGSSLYSTVGVNAILVLKVSSVDSTAGHTLTISFGDISLTFTLAASLDDSGLTLPVGTGLNYSTWCTALYNAFLNNYYLRTFFTITLLDDHTTYREIQFIARNTGTKYTPVFSAGSVTGIAQDYVTAGVDEVTRDDFAVVATIWGLTNNKIAEEIKPAVFGYWPEIPDQNHSAGKVVFDFSEVLESELESRYGRERFTWPMPDPAQGTHLIIGWSNYWMSYKVSFAEIYGQNVRVLSDDSIRTVVGGGLSRETLAALNEADTDYWSQTGIYEKFLTWAPAIKPTGKYTPEILWLPTVPFGRSMSNLKLAVSVHFTDGTIHAFYATYLASVSGQVLEILCGYDTLQLGTINTNKQVAYYLIWLEDANSLRITDFRQFELEPVFNDHERNFIFRNSFSLYDAVNFRGRGQMDLVYDRQNGNVVTEEDLDFWNPSVKAFDPTEGQQLKASSGWVSAEMKNYLRDMLLSKEIYEALDDLLFPVVITSAKIESYFNDGETLYSITIEYSRAWADRFFSYQQSANYSLFKPRDMIIQEDLTQGVGVVFEASDSISYYGFPKEGTTSESDATWRIMRIEKVTVEGGGNKTVITWADGNMNYDNVFANAASLTYAFLTA